MRLIISLLRPQAYRTFTHQRAINPKAIHDPQCKDACVIVLYALSKSANIKIKCNVLPVASAYDLIKKQYYVKKIQQTGSFKNKINKQHRLGIGMVRSEMSYGERAV
jgi:hypothetical protein